MKWAGGRRPGLPQHHNDKPCDYLINFPGFSPQCRAVVGAVVAQRGPNGWKLNPNIVGGKKINRSFGVPGTDGTNVGFCENISKG